MVRAACVAPAVLIVVVLQHADLTVPPRPATTHVLASELVIKHLLRHLIPRLGEYLRQMPLSSRSRSHGR